jgi:D-amino-acid dehydrogenase
MPPAEKIWYGYRPCSPDGLPYIGKLRAFENLVLATGHAMMGLSLGPATGQVVNDLLMGREIEGRYRQFFDPSRYQ